MRNNKFLWRLDGFERPLLLAAGKYLGDITDAQMSIIFWFENKYKHTPLKISWLQRDSILSKHCALISIALDYGGNFSKLRTSVIQYFENVQNYCSTALHWNFSHLTPCFTLISRSYYQSNQMQKWSPDVLSLKSWFDISSRGKFTPSALWVDGQRLL